MRLPWNAIFATPNTELIGELICLHSYALILVAGVLSFVAVGLGAVITNRHSYRLVDHAPYLEITWTVVPVLGLIALAGPSLRLLYAIDEALDPVFTVKAIGHQWYWRYEYGDFRGFEFDSYMVREEDLESGDLRLLEVDKRLVLPVGNQLRMIVTSDDVIHSWAVPQFGIKIDAVPGRLNGVPLNLAHTGIFYGMCSEICGVNHAFMPIGVEGVHLADFVQWAKRQEALHLAENA